jgi:hypothetical protein
MTAFRIVEVICEHLRLEAMAAHPLLMSVLCTTRNLPIGFHAARVD